MPVSWEALLLSIAVYVALPCCLVALVVGYVSRRWIVATNGEEWF